MRSHLVAVVCACLASTAPVHAEETPAPSSPAGPAEAPVDAPTPQWARTGPGVSFIPFGGYSSDLGLELGVLSSLFIFGGKVKPYALRVDGLLFTSTRLQSYAYVNWDAPSVAGSALRMGGHMGIANALSENYCGMAMRADCDERRATHAANQFLDEKHLLGSPVAGPARDELSHKYYWYRLVAPTFGVYGRYRLTRALLLFARYDATYFKPNPYPLSRLAIEMPLGARHGGLSSTPQVGIVVDTRDNEPAPTSGTFSELTVRVSNNIFGSGYNWAGLHSTVRVYIPMLPSRKMVLAMRFIADAMFGDVPFYEQGFFGGIDGLNGIGGERAGRGIRFQRYRGKGRFLWTPEVRWTLGNIEFRLPFFGMTEIDWGTVVFTDVGKVVGEWPQLSLINGIFSVHDRDHVAPTALVYGAGAGLRFGLNRTFILKFDFALSPVEQDPGIYINVGHIF